MSGSAKPAWSPNQLRAIEVRGQNALVSAGAGSGKTTVLVERVLQCLTGPDAVDLDQLLIVTFTEAAAAEMRERIGLRLQRALEQALSAEDRTAARQLRRQLALLEQARISTLHSFCLDIVRRNFLRLGLEPSFQILAEDQAALLRKELFRDLLERRLQENDSGFLGMLWRFQAEDPEGIFPLVDRLDEFARSQPQPAQWLDEMAQMFETASASAWQALPWLDGFFAWVRHQLAGISRHVTQAYESAWPEPSLAEHAEALTACMQDLQSALTAALVRDLAAVRSAVAQAMDQLKKRITVRENSPAKQAVLDLRKKARDSLTLVQTVLSRSEDEFLDDVKRLAPDIRRLVEFVRGFQELYSVRKRRMGVLDFSDLEHLAYQVLLDPDSGEALRLQSEIAEIFVDEYQDTSPIQDAIVQTIARPHGNLFVVGDVKQSIYRFRMAEPRLFMDKYRSAGPPPLWEVIDLQDNYRSRPEIVEVVNFLFQQWFSESFGGIAYDDRARMRAGRTTPADPPDALGGTVDIHLIERAASLDAEDASDQAVPEETDGGEDAQPLAEEDLGAVEREAMFIAWQIQEWMGRTPGGHRKLVWDKDANTFRPLAWRDIVILMRTAAGRIETVLEVLAQAGIPAYGVTSAGFYDTLEIRWLLAALRTIDNPRQEIELAAVLRSPMFGFSDPELAQVRLASRGNFYDAVVQAARSEAVPPDLRMKCVRFLGQLRAWRALAGKAGAETVLRQVLEDTGLLSYLSGMQGGPGRRANVEMLLDRARAFDQSSIDGVYGFVEWVQQSVAEQIDTGEARTLGEHEDVVRVMTIHKSKGLEFPVVFVMDLGKQFRLDRGEESFALHRDLGFGPQFNDYQAHRRWRTLPSIAIRHVNMLESLAEEARVLYVALTRARDKLVLVGSARHLTEQMARAQMVARGAKGATLPEDVMASAKTYLDWLMPAVLRASGSTTAAPPLSLHVWDRGHPMPQTLQSRTAAAGPQQVITGDPERLFQALSAAAPPAPQTAEAVMRALDWQHPDRWTTAVPGKVSATDLRRLAAAAQRAGTRRKEDMTVAIQAVAGEDSGSPAAALPGLAQTGPARQESWRARAAERLLADPAFVGKTPPEAAVTLQPEGSAGLADASSAQERGTAFHAVMQHLDLGVAAHEAAVTAALAELVAAGRLTPDQRAQVNVADVCRFLASWLAERIRRAKRHFRELPFYLRISLDHSESESTVASGRFVVVQGVIDCLAEEDGGWLLVDYKTDDIDERQVPDQAAAYHGQVAAYAQAVREVTGGAPVEAYIYFVRPGVAVPVPKMDLAAVLRPSLA